MLNILTGPIRPLSPSANMPQPAYGAEPPKEGGGALETGSMTVETISSEDEEPPDFSALDAKERGESIPAMPGTTEEVRETPAKGAEPARAPAVTEKPAGEAPAKATAPAKKGANTEEAMPDIPAMKPEAPGSKAEHPTDPKRYADGTFKPGMDPAKPAEAAKPAVEPAKSAAPAKPEAAKPVPADDKDIDAIEPKPNASDRTKNDFKALKESTKAARQYARELEAKLKEAETKLTGDLPPEIKEKLAAAEESEKFRAMFELENEPKARAAYQQKLTTAEETILKRLMTDERIGLPEKGEGPHKSAEWLKKVGFDSKEGRAQINAWINSIRTSTKDELLADEVKDLFRGRDRVVSERSGEIEKLRTDRDGYLKSRHDEESNQFKSWGQTADTTLMELAKGHEWADYMKEPDGATAEQKAFVAAHNERIGKEVVPAFNKAILDVYGRNPKATIEMVFKAFEADQELRPQLTAARADIAAKDARIAELEAQSQGVRRITEVSRVEQAPGKVSSTPKGIEGAKEASSDDAIEAYMKEKGIA